MTNPKPLERTFTARELDVESRKNEIKNWDVLNKEGKTIGNGPVPINLGEKFISVDKLPHKAIFWTQGIRIDDNGNTYGKGMLNLELILVDKLGFDLSQNPYSLNETIRVIIRTVTPFFILFLVAFLTVPDDKKRLDQFFARMKTPVLSDPEQDAKEMKLSFKNPQRFDHKKLFPNSNWEFYKWNKLDAVGFFIAVLVLLGMLAMLQILVSIGG